MESRLLKTLLAEATTATDLVAWARSVCRGGSHLARCGLMDDAFGAIQSVRARFGPNLHPEVASWLMLAEGILYFCQYNNKAAYDRLQRAHGLAVAFRTASAIPSCAAWMALIEFNTLRRDRMVNHLREAIQLASATDHQALARAALVAACALHLAGDFERARPWYEKARRHATAEGDEATLGALFFNVASFRMAEVRLLDAFGAQPDAEAKRAFLEAAGSYSFDMMTRNSAQESWRFLLRGQHLIVERKYAEALEILALVDAENVDSTKTAPVVLADQAWAHINVGNDVEARRLVEMTRERFAGLLEADDRAFVYGRLSQVLLMLGRDAESAELRVAAQEQLDLHRAYQAELMQLMKQLPD